MSEARTVSPQRTAGLVLVALTWALFLALTGSPEAILFTVPVFLLAAPLAFGRYVGEEVLASLRRASRRRTGAPAVLDLVCRLLAPAGRAERLAAPVRGPPAPVA